MSLPETSHRRLNILTGEYILVSPHRTMRPWQGQEEPTGELNRPEHDDECPLCAGNIRANGERNPNFKSTYVFTNDFAAIQQEGASHVSNENDLLVSHGESGTCRVMCFSPQHNVTLSEMSIEQIVDVIKTWAAQYSELSSRTDINHVQIFENKGAIMGCSNPHPHCQIWAQQSIPGGASIKGARQLAYKSKKGGGMLEDYITLELQKQERILDENEHFVTLVPFWATWPYEAMILPKKRRSCLTELTNLEVIAYAQMIQQLSFRYDRLFNCQFPYSAGIHQAPTDGSNQDHWHFHHSFYPPLLRSAKVKKFMVGYEMFGEAQRDISPEQAAVTLRALPKSQMELEKLGTLKS